MLSDWSVRAGHLISSALAAALGVPEPPQAWIAFAVQARRECADGAAWAGGTKFNNPLNLTTGGGAFTWPAQTGTYSGGDSAEWHGDFAAFPDLATGAGACALNYASSSYVAVHQAFASGDPVALAQAIQDSPWDSGHYGGTLVDEVRMELAQQEATVMAKLDDDDRAWLASTINAARDEILTKLDSGFNTTVPVELRRVEDHQDPATGGPR